jgi:hypothetical protein
MAVVKETKGILVMALDGTYSNKLFCGASPSEPLYS